MIYCEYGPALDENNCPLPCGNILSIILNLNEGFLKIRMC
jgi:hypothetical protein